jgi:hypothetical protein
LGIRRNKSGIRSAAMGLNVNMAFVLWSWLLGSAGPHK